MKDKKEINTIKIEKEKQAENKKIEREVKKTINGFIPGYGHKRTLGQRAADSLTKYAGSWSFILFFFVFLTIWMMANVYAWTQQWDPYPFILLNLVLSCLAAIQAPIILMSQNRTTQRDRLKAEHDYQINRKAEKEIQQIIRQINRLERRLVK